MRQVSGVLDAAEETRKTGTLPAIIYNIPSDILSSPAPPIFFAKTQHVIAPCPQSQPGQSCSKEKSSKEKRLVATRVPQRFDGLTRFN